MQVLPLVLLLASPLYDYEPRDIEDAIFQNVVSDGPAVPRISEALRKLPQASRADAITALAKAARTYTSNKAFAERYAAFVSEQLPPKPTPARSAAEMKRAAKDDMAKKRKELEAALATLPAKDRAAALKQFDDGTKQMLTLYENPDGIAAIENARVAEEKEKYDAAAARWPADHRVRVRAMLKRFLDNTSDVDFGAKVEGGRFADAELEAKPLEWKLAYRCGKGATAAARTAAEAWLRTL